ncbi:hypothetical protein ACWF62_04535 [Rhodococcus sp. NPDC054953]
MPRQRARAATVLSGALLLLVTGCASDNDTDKVKTIEPATAAASPAVSNPPAGGVVTLGGPVSATVFDDDTDTVVMLTPDARGLLLLPGSVSGMPPGALSDVPLRTVSLPGGVAALSAPRDGVVAVPAGRAVVRVDLATGDTTSTAVDGDVQAVALLADGRMAVGTAAGEVLEIEADGTSSGTVSGLVSVDALGEHDGRVTALDRRQSSVTEINFDDDRLGLALRAGDGATNLVADRFGRVIITDTNDGELLSHTTDPLMLHQRYPVPNSPYGVAVDEKTGMVWVTVTGTNEVVGYDLSTGIPVEKHRYPTVRQPNSVAVDSESGTVFIASATGDGLQRIDVTGH